jgi:hypothetical protein
MNISPSYKPVTLSEALNRTLEKRSREFQEQQTAQQEPKETYVAQDEQSSREQFAFDADYGRFFGASTRRHSAATLRNVDTDTQNERTDSQATENPGLSESEFRNQFRHDPDYGRFFNSSNRRATSGAIRDLLGGDA